MLVINGAQGEGGGQILRTSLSLSMITGTDVKIENIRAGRARPGLMRQHLACVKAAQQISGAEVSGAKVSSTSIIFKPGEITAGKYEFAVGTAGSTLLIFQTVLPALATLNAETELTFHGGTHNMMAPSFDFIALAFAPLMKTMGVEIEMTLQRHGFYPQGGGEWRAIIKPSGQFKPLELVETGELIKRQVVVTSSHVPEHIASREMHEIALQCGWNSDEMRAETVHSLGSGNIVSLRLFYEQSAEVIEQVGKVGVSAERVARHVINSLQRFQVKRVPVGEYLADQLLLPMATGAGGVFRTLKPSCHLRTNRDVIQQFMHKPIKLAELAKGVWEIRC